MFAFHELSDDLFTECVPRGHRVLFSRACKTFRTRFARLRLPVSLRVMIRKQDLPVRLAHMSHMFRIGSLDFSHVNLTKALLRAFAARERMDWSNLHTLMLGHDNTTTGRQMGADHGPEVAAWLRRCSALTTTDALRRTHLHPDVWAAVRHCESLDLECLDSYKVKTVDVNNLGDNLANCTRLTALNLSKNRSLPIDMMHILAPALTSNSSLTVLNLDYIHRTGHVEQNIISYPATWRGSRNTLQVLNLNGFVFGNMLNGEAFSMLGKELGHYPQLRGLGLHGTRMTPTGLAAFVSGLAEGQGLPSLTELGMGDNFLNVVASVPIMEELMQMLPNLTHLELQEGSLHPNMLFADWITKLQYLNIAKNFRVYYDRWECLRGLGGNRLRGLQHLDMSGVDLNNACLVHLAAALEGCQALRSLEMVNCQWKEDFNDGLSAVMRALDTCSRLTELDFSGVTVIGTALAEAGQFGGSLRVLKLKHTLLNNECVPYLAPIVDGCTALEKLDLACNCFDDQGLSAMVRALSRPCSVRVLRLSGTKIRNNGVVGLVQAQALWPKLVEIQMNDCCIGAVAARSFAQAAAGWPCLLRLDLENNFVYDDGARMLVESSRLGKWSVRLGHNYLSRSCRWELAKEEGCEV